MSFMIGSPLAEYRGLLLGMGILFVIGVLDDLYDISAKLKLIAQFVVAVIMVVWDGQVVTNIGDLFGTGDIFLGSLSIPFTILCVVGLINAINMIDGMDGLAGSILLSNLVLLALLSGLVGVTKQTDLLCLLIAAIFAFLIFNFRRRRMLCATVFLGDAGSMMLGYALAWFIIDLYCETNGLVYPVTFAWILALPVFDAIILILRRTLKRKSPLAADREHLHHIFLRAGYSYNMSVNILIAINILLGLMGIMLWYFNVPSPLIFVWLVLIFCVHLFFVMHAWVFMKALKRLRYWKNSGNSY